MTPTYSGADVNAVLTAVRNRTLNGDAQLSILAHALVVAAKSCGVAEETLLAQVRMFWAKPDRLVPLSDLEGLS